MKLNWTMGPAVLWATSLGAIAQETTPDGMIAQMESQMSTLPQTAREIAQDALSVLKQMNASNHAYAREGHRTRIDHNQGPNGELDPGDSLYINASMQADTSKWVDHWCPFLTAADRKQLSEWHSSSVMVEEMAHVTINDAIPGVTPKTADACWEAEALNVKLAFLCEIGDSLPAGTALKACFDTLKNSVEATFQLYFTLWLYGQ